jgi:hypothetical protein
MANDPPPKSGSTTQNQAWKDQQNQKLGKSTDPPKDNPKQK